MAEGGEGPVPPPVPPKDKPFGFVDVPPLTQDVSQAAIGWTVGMKGPSFYEQLVVARANRELDRQDTHVPVPSTDPGVNKAIAYLLESGLEDVFLRLIGIRSTAGMPIYPDDYANGVVAYLRGMQQQAGSRGHELPVISGELHDVIYNDAHGVTMRKVEGEVPRFTREGRSEVVGDVVATHLPRSLDDLSHPLGLGKIPEEVEAGLRVEEKQHLRTVVDNFRRTEPSFGAAVDGHESSLRRRVSGIKSKQSFIAGAADLHRVRTIQQAHEVMA